MQAAGDIMLGWVRTSDVDGVERDYYVRQLWDAKGSALVETMNPTALAYYAGSLRPDARSRPRPRRRQRRDRAPTLAAATRFDRALAAFAEAYADQNERDYAGGRRGRRQRAGSRS